MDDAKYVIVTGTFGEKSAIIFDMLLSHDTFSHSAVSAGFVSFVANKNGKIEVYVYGGSTSLNLKSGGKKDAELICKALNNPHADDKLFVPAGW